MQIVEFINGAIDNETFTKQIKDEITSYRSSGEYYAMIEGIAYYNQENTAIMERQKMYYADKHNAALVDPYKANHKLPSGYMALIVDQKLGYSINENMDVTEIPFVMDYDEIGTEASMKALAYIQFYDNNGEIGYKLIPSEQCIPVYENNVFVAMIREYVIDGITYISISTSEVIIEFYVEKDKYINISIRPILTKQTSVNGSIVGVTPLSWGTPPFAIMKNNHGQTTDLKRIKRLIDVYDITSSDFANNIDDFQDVYWILKNYGGEDIDEYMNQVKKFKTIKVGDDGEAKAETIQIPTEARKTILDILERNIYKFSMGVDYDTITGATTATEIKAKTMNLDLKANKFENQYRLFMRQVEYFINKYNSFKGLPAIEPIVIKFNRAMIVNKAEEVESLMKLKGSISNETLIELLPYNIDVEKELERMAKEQEDELKLLGGEMGFGDE